jgi:hypothetical protein
MSCDHDRPSSPRCTSTAPVPGDEVSGPAAAIAERFTPETVPLTYDLPTRDVSRIVLALLVRDRLANVTADLPDGVAAHVRRQL